MLKRSYFIYKEAVKRSVCLGLLGEGLPRLFEGGRSLHGKEKEQKALIEKMYGKIGEISDLINRLVTEHRGKCTLRQ